MSGLNESSPRRCRMLTGLAGAMMLGVPAACAAVPRTDATAATDGDSKKLQEDDARGGCVVYVGPRQNVRMRFDEDASTERSERDRVVRKKCEGRTNSVGPRHNIKRTFKRDCESSE